MRLGTRTHSRLLRSVFAFAVLLCTTHANNSIFENFYDLNECTESDQYLCGCQAVPAVEMSEIKTLLGQEPPCELLCEQQTCEQECEESVCAVRMGSFGEYCTKQSLHQAKVNFVRSASCSYNEDMLVYECVKGESVAYPDTQTYNAIIDGYCIPSCGLDAELFQCQFEPRFRDETSIKDEDLDSPPFIAIAGGGGGLGPIKTSPPPEDDDETSSEKPEQSLSPDVSAEPSAPSPSVEPEVSEPTKSETIEPPVEEPQVPLIDEPTDEKSTPAPAPESDETPAPDQESDETETPSPAPESDETPAPATTSEETETPSPAPESDETPAPAPESDETPSPAPESDETPAPAPESDETPAPAPESDETPSPAPESDETPSPAPESEETETPAPTSEETPALAPESDKTPSLAPESDETLSPAPESEPAEQTPDIKEKADLEETPAPEPEPEPESLDDEEPPLLERPFVPVVQVAPTTGTTVSTLSSRAADTPAASRTSNAEVKYWPIIVGGCLVGLLLISIIAFVVLRRRKDSKKPIGPFLREALPEGQMDEEDPVPSGRYDRVSSAAEQATAPAVISSR